MTTPRVYENLKLVTPTTTYLIASCPCEETTAAIRNLAIKAIETNNPEGVGLRYLQSKDGEKNTKFQIYANAIIILFLFENARRALYRRPIDIFTLYSILLFLVVSPLLAVKIPPNIRNTSRYKETKMICEAWLKDKLGEPVFKKIDELGYMGKLGYIPLGCQMWVRPCKQKWKKEAENTIKKICHK